MKPQYIEPAFPLIYNGNSSIFSKYNVSELVQFCAADSSERNTPMETRRQLTKFILSVAVFAILFFPLKRFHTVITSHLSTSWDLKIESINLATIKSLQQGKAIYDTGFFGDLP